MRARNIIKNIAVSLLLAAALHGTAQAAVSQYKFTHLTTASSGLSYDGVNSILQDSRGFSGSGPAMDLTAMTAGNSISSSLINWDLKPTMSAVW